jgi:hypothetical protein
MAGRNNGKKLLAVRIMRHTCEIIHLLSGENPNQVRILFHLLSFLFSPWLASPSLRRSSLDHRRCRCQLRCP